MPSHPRLNRSSERLRLQLLRALSGTHALAFAAGMAVGSAPAVAQILIVHLHEQAVIIHQIDQSTVTETNPETDVPR